MSAFFSRFHGIKTKFDDEKKILLFVFSLVFATTHGFYFLSITFLCFISFHEIIHQNNKIFGPLQHFDVNLQHKNQFKRKILISVES